MTTYIALLRGVNVGGNKLVAMSALRELCGQLGCTEVRTLIQSGNVVFRSTVRSASALEQRLEAAALQQIGLSTTFFVRTAAEWAEIMAGNPFPEAAANDPGRLLLMLLKAAPAPAAVDALRAAIKGREVVQVNGRHAYLTYPDGAGKSRLTNAVIDAKLSTRGSGRNWNTVRKLGALAGA